MNCTRCEGTGFLNLEQDDFSQLCDCCGNGKEWYGIPGEHYNNTDPPGKSGPYCYNGGLSECDWLNTGEIDAYNKKEVQEVTTYPYKSNKK